MSANRTKNLLAAYPGAVTLLALGLACSAGCVGEGVDTAERGPDAAAGGGTGAAAAGTGASAGSNDGRGGDGAGSSAAGGVGDGGSSPAGGSGSSIVCAGPGARFVTDVVTVDYGLGQSFGQDQMPDIVYGPPLGGGCCAGSVDVVSLGNGGKIVVAFEANAIVDGPGADFVVFENAFQIGGDPNSVFAELATVAVSEDGQTWVEFPCTATSPPYGSCAGWHPVHLNGDDGPIEPATSGGDLFDLGDVGVALARYVRITDRPDLDGMSGVFDLDAVGIVNPLCL